MAIFITAAGTYRVDPNEVYVIDPCASGTIKFVGNPMYPGAEKFTVELRESPDHDNKVEIKVYSDNDLSPTIKISDGYVGPKTELDLKKATETEVVAGNDVIISKMEVSECGEDKVSFGAFDRVELSKLKVLDLDGNGPHGAPAPTDTLMLDTSWMNGSELAALEAELASSGYTTDGAGTWSAADANNDGKIDEDLHVELKLDLDGNGSREFTLKLDHWEKIEFTSGLDYIVEGTAGADLIDAAYLGDPEGDRIDALDNETGGNEDLVDAGAGDDTVLAGAGDDTVYAGSGDDSVEGGAGNDVLFGDADLGEAHSGDVREAFKWSEFGVSGGDVIPSGSSLNTGSVDVSFTYTAPPVTENEYESGLQNVTGIDSGGETVNDRSSFESEMNGNGNSGTYTLDFARAVENVSFRINDIDGDGVVKVMATGPDGPVEVILTGSPNLTLLDTDGVPGVDTADSNGGYEPDFGENYTILVEIPGPLTDITIIHSQDGSGGTGVNFTDVYFDVPATITEGVGNDTLVGGAGDDLIDGQGGNDVLSGGAGDDTIVGGAGDDMSGGADADTFQIDPLAEDASGENATGFSVDGGSTGDDNDTLDLSAYESFRNLDETDDPDGNSTSGTVEVENGEGEWVTVTFAEIEKLILPPANPDGVVDGEDFAETMNPLYDDANDPTDGGGDIIDGPDGLDDSIRGNGGDDNINAGQGNDTVDGGTGNDTIDGATGNDTLSGGEGDDVLLGGSGDDSLSGNTGDDSLDGGAGNDALGGAEGDDTLKGGGGEDTLTGGSGNDSLDGGADNDTIIGGSGNDSIVGGFGDDVIDAGIGGFVDRDTPVFPGNPFFIPGDLLPDNDKDTVFAGGGDDTITTGDDADYIDAGTGNDVVDSGIDDDTVIGGLGDDLIILGEGSDSVLGGFGNDTIYGGLGPSVPDIVNVADDGTGSPIGPDPVLDNGDDFINAGAGDDVVYGEDDNDTILGEDGRDFLDGGVDDDSISGGDNEDTIIGGQGADTMDGGDDADTFVIGTFGGKSEGIGDVVIGGEGVSSGVDDDTLDLSGAGPLDIKFDSELAPVDQIDPTGTPGESGIVIFYTDASQTTESGRMTFKEIENVIPCFTPGALIATPRGEMPVEGLREGDKVITRDNGIQEIRWIGSRTLGRDDLADAPNLKPILIKAGSLGHGLPERDMLVSPQHRVLVAGEQTQLYFDESEVLVAAKHLVNGTSIRRLDTVRTTYVHFMFDRHEVVLSDGAWTESFQPGDQTLGAMGTETRDEIVALFPELGTEAGIKDYTAARRALKAHEAQLLQL